MYPHSIKENAPDNCLITIFVMVDQAAGWGIFHAKQSGYPQIPGISFCENGILKVILWL